VLSRGLLDVLAGRSPLAMIWRTNSVHCSRPTVSTPSFAFNDPQCSLRMKARSLVSTFPETPPRNAPPIGRRWNCSPISPYQGKLADAGLFLRALQQEAPELKSLIRPHLGSRLTSRKRNRMEALEISSPALQADRVDQIAALPLGARIKLDPWSSRVELVKGKPVA